MSVTFRTAAPVLLAAIVLGATPVTWACTPREPTRQTGPGPHDYSRGLAESRLWQDGDAGEPLFFRARVLDTCGRAVAGARVRMLHANQNGNHEQNRWRADLRTDDGGAFQLVTVNPGYAGGMARHVHFMITHPEHHSLTTRLYFRDDPAIDDSVEDLAMVLEEVQRGEATGWVAGYEFVVAPK